MCERGRTEVGEGERGRETIKGGEKRRGEPPTDATVSCGNPDESGAARYQRSLIVPLCDKHRAMPAALDASCQPGCEGEGL